MVEAISTDYDTLETRCPTLGHPVPFSYCRQCSDARPCRKIADCWSHQVDVGDFLSRRYTPEEIEQILAPPKPKILQIIELARKASAGKG